MAKSTLQHRILISNCDYLSLTVNYDEREGASPRDLISMVQALISSVISSGATVVRSQGSSSTMGLGASMPAFSEPLVFFAFPGLCLPLRALKNDMLRKKPTVADCYVVVTW